MHAGFPDAALRENCAKLTSVQVPAVLIATGAMNPVHRGHAAILRVAAAAVQSKYHNQVVVASYLSPSHDDYVLPKVSSAKTLFIPGSRRVALARVLLAEDPGSAGIEASGWEAEVAQTFVDFPEVTAACRQQLEQLVTSLTGRELVVYYVCGTDLFQRCYGGIRRILAHQRQGVVVVPRDGSESQGLRSDVERRIIVAAAPTGNIAGASSTAVRAAFIRGRLGADDPIAEILTPGVMQYLREAFAAHLEASSRDIYISASMLARRWRPSESMQHALLFFGSKRMWMFPKSPAEAAEAAKQPTDYKAFPGELLSLIKKKEPQRQLHWLKPDVLGPIDVPGGVLGDFSAASRWISGVQIGAPRLPLKTDLDLTFCTYAPLILERNWWRDVFARSAPWWESLPQPKEAARSQRWEDVVHNFEHGLHSYPDVAQLVRQSNPLLIPQLFPQAP
eukprot:TRINITY_DN18919_c0_g1_i1.p1 TRINITY_DN18919_c0_g1~~TRINITY_DN18919_c0_g1_i1.p1  ORF type:complete len:449 (-),score=69.39 TRINITY_DN18919_c0_g1_i1:44-1390(-)